MILIYISSNKILSLFILINIYIIVIFIIIYTHKYLYNSDIYYYKYKNKYFTKLRNIFSNIFFILLVGTI